MNYTSFWIYFCIKNQFLNLFIQFLCSRGWALITENNGGRTRSFPQTQNNAEVHFGLISVKGRGSYANSSTEGVSANEHRWMQDQRCILHKPLYEPVHDDCHRTRNPRSLLNVRKGICHLFWAVGSVMNSHHTLSLPQSPSRRHAPTTAVAPQFPMAEVVGVVQSGPSEELWRRQGLPRLATLVSTCPEDQRCPKVPCWHQNNHAVMSFPPWRPDARMVQLRRNPTPSITWATTTDGELQWVRTSRPKTHRQRTIWVAGQFLSLPSISARHGY
jgi:hypothetical protein